MQKFPFVIDPTKVGPLGRCSVCLTPENNEVTYCVNCGHIGRFFATSEKVQPGAACAVHPNVPATTFCVICGKPVCYDCVEREGVSLVSALPTPQCRACLRRSAEFETAYRERLEQEKVCAKHPDQDAELRCIECQLPHLRKLSLFHHRGVDKNEARNWTSLPKLFQEKDHTWQCSPPMDIAAGRKD